LDPSRHTALYLGITLSLVISGCSANPAPSALATSSPTPLAVIDSQLRPNRSQVAPPQSRDEAFAAAEKTVNGAEATLVGILRGEYAADSLNEFEAEAYLSTTNSFIDGLAESSSFEGIEGEASVWFPDSDSSTAEELISGGVAYPYGSVTQYGCFHSLWKVIDGGSPSGKSSVGEFLPARMTVNYEPTRRLWLITDGLSLVDSADAPSCSLP
jgi:hypothetical protein